MNLEPFFSDFQQRHHLIGLDQIQTCRMQKAIIKNLARMIMEKYHSKMESSLVSLTLVSQIKQLDILSYRTLSAAMTIINSHAILTL